MDCNRVVKLPISFFDDLNLLALLLIWQKTAMSPTITPAERHPINASYPADKFDELKV